MIIKKNKNRTNEFDEGIEQELNEEENSAQIGVQDEAEADVDLFDIDNIDFKQRQERRKGDRRRGFRRIDDRNLISRAKEEAESIREASAKEGYQAGIDAAKDDIMAVRNSMEEFFGAKQSVYDSIAPNILDIALEISKKIIKKEVTENPELLIESVKDILKGLSKEETKIMLKVNPTQVAILKQDVPEIVEMAGLEAKVIIVPDENTMEGGCLVTTSNGVIDATIETQLAIISEVLKEM